MALQLGDTAPDFTPVCTTELGEFARRKKEFDDRHTMVIGVSVDSVASHEAWSADIDEIIRVLDALQLSAAHAVSTPVNWRDGDDVIISPAISDDEAAARFPKGFRTLKPYLRLTPRPDR